MTDKFSEDGNNVQSILSFGMRCLHILYALVTKRERVQSPFPIFLNSLLIKEEMDSSKSNVNVNKGLCKG